MYARNYATVLDQMRPFSGQCCMCLIQEIVLYASWTGHETQSIQELAREWSKNRLALTRYDGISLADGQSLNGTHPWEQWERLHP